MNQREFNNLVINYIVLTFFDAFYIRLGRNNIRLLEMNAEQSVNYTCFLELVIGDIPITYKMPSIFHLDTQEQPAILAAKAIAKKLTTQYAESRIERAIKTLKSRDTFLDTNKLHFFTK
jgi:hypothetical protein